MSFPNQPPTFDRPTPYRLKPHQPRRPLWHCSGCAGEPWPCGMARLLLWAEFEGAPVGLAIYMA